MMQSGSYVHLFVLSGLFMLCISASADVCYEPYRLLYTCGTYPPFITAPLAIQDLGETSDDSIDDIIDNIIDDVINEIIGDIIDDIIDSIIEQDEKQEEQEMKIPNAGLSSGLSLSPGGGGQDLEAMGSGSVKTYFGAAFATPRGLYRNSEVFRAQGLFVLSSSHEFRSGGRF